MMVALNRALSKVSDILDSAPDNKTRLECIRLQNELCRSMSVISTEPSVIERAAKTIKIISPFPGEHIPTEEELNNNNKEESDEVDQSLEEESESDNDIPTEEQDKEKE